MARVVVVHGVGRELDTSETLLASLSPAVTGGVNLALRRDAGLAGRVTPLAQGDITCAAYGDLFRRPGARSGTPQYEAEDVADGLETELLMAWWAEAARLDPAVLGPSDAGRGVLAYAASRPLRLAAVRRALDALTRTRFFGSVSDAFLIAALKQFRRYFDDPGIRAAARARVLQGIGQDTRVVVGHSLGSVVAYEALCPGAVEGPVTLVTLGSPLGIRNLTFDRLDPAPVTGVGVWPKSVDRWHNVSDAGDIVALVHELAPRFGPGVRDHHVHNGTTMHDLSAYLTAVETGAAIADGLAAR
ncbi:antibiotic ABC transporter ATP-binding protein [Streptomyces sp. NPDC003036]|uniref:antibiotic ABC transporter ATP-binding protein n=1 Tax=Streptomyces sp. NPDC003036 TaxID=3154442 RepID=UPI0033B42DC1